MPKCINTADTINYIVFSSRQGLLCDNCSDHKVQIVDFEVNTLCKATRTMWTHSLKKCDWDQVRVALGSAPWHVMSALEDISVVLDDKWNFFCSILMDTLNRGYARSIIRKKMIN